MSRLIYQSKGCYPEKGNPNRTIGVDSSGKCTYGQVLFATPKKEEKWSDAHSCHQRSLPSIQAHSLSSACSVEFCLLCCQVLYGTWCPCPDRPSSLPCLTPNRKCQGRDKEIQGISFGGKIVFCRHRMLHRSAGSCIRKETVCRIDWQFVRRVRRQCRCFRRRPGAQDNSHCTSGNGLCCCRPFHHCIVLKT